MPKNTWNETALTGVYLINQSPTKAKMGYGFKPDENSIKIFGCKAFAWVPKQKREKLDAKSRKLVTIGYVPNGYRLWDVYLKKVVNLKRYQVLWNQFCIF